MYSLEKHLFILGTLIKTKKVDKTQQKFVKKNSRVRKERGQIVLLLRACSDVPKNWQCA